MTLLMVVALVLLFGVVNGFQDTVNSIATVVSIRVLNPRQAVIWAAFFNFIAYLIFGLHVANTVGTGIVRAETVTLPVVLAGMIAAITWNITSWLLSIPSSSSHALLGGFLGASVAHAGLKLVFYSSIIKIAAFILLAPLLSMIISMIISVVLLNISSRLSNQTANKYFRRLQLLSSAAYNLGHGASDAQKIMGIIFISLIAAGKVATNLYRFGLFFPASSL